MSDLRDLTEAEYGLALSARRLLRILGLGGGACLLEQELMLLTDRTRAVIVEWKQRETKCSA